MLSHAEWLIRPLLPVANKKRIWYIPTVEVKSCRVTISDMEGVANTVKVTAATLYEAVALGLKQIRGNDWVEGIAGALNPVSDQLHRSWDLSCEEIVRK
jgi:hypothetical protein